MLQLCHIEYNEKHDGKNMSYDMPNVLDKLDKICKTHSWMI